MLQRVEEEVDHQNRTSWKANRATEFGGFEFCNFLNRKTQRIRTTAQRKYLRKSVAISRTRSWQFLLYQLDDEGISFQILTSCLSSEVNSTPLTSPSFTTRFPLSAILRSFYHDASRIPCKIFHTLARLNTFTQCFFGTPVARFLLW